MSAAVQARASRLELFKFSLYVFTPMAAFLFFGAPEFYEEHVTPLVSHFRRDEIKQVAPPQTTTELKAELARLRDERLSKKAEREGSARV
ncbi:hypothetical protein BCR35DRAFT_304640 [Leucosporidium creatinivorum]|uniref:Uncharacterized protein n=1 Tax=Leucosporidium creatinivorum TaxID=106004 RepID=A0A1Y2F7D8_9BASI|nr:hypothetical protein BCR35DRAFT_304640 [Leucosporidium creatinivorum]